MVHEPIPIAGRDENEVITQAELVVHNGVTSTTMSS